MFLADVLQCAQRGAHKRIVAAVASATAFCTAFLSRIFRWRCTNETVDDAGPFVVLAAGVFVSRRLRAREA